MYHFIPQQGRRVFIHNPINLNKYWILALLFLAIHAAVLPSVFNILMAFQLKWNKSIWAMQDTNIWLIFRISVSAEDNEE